MTRLLTGGWQLSKQGVGDLSEPKIHGVAIGAGRPDLATPQNYACTSSLEMEPSELVGLAGLEPATS